MNRYSLLVISTVALLAFGMNVQAALATASDANFSWTSDSLTGLDWLDFDGGAAPSTVERTYNDVSAQFGMGGDYEG